VKPPDSELRLRLLSDDMLYQRAVTLGAEHQITSAQISGLLNASKGPWRELEMFVDQRTRRDLKPELLLFYQQLKKELQWLHGLPQVEGFIPEGLTDRHRKAAQAEWAARLAREYMQHLTAELLLRRSQGRREEDHADF